MDRLSSNPFFTSLAVLSLVFAAAGCSSPSGVRTAEFGVRHELVVNLPSGTQEVRIWFAMPQDDPTQEVRDFKVEAELPHRIETDSQGNRSVYVEAKGSASKEIRIVETFALRRREQRSGAAAAKSRPIGAEDRDRLAGYLGPNEHVPIDADMRKLSAEIVGGETNPIAAARKLYDWELENIDYWVKDPKNKKASPVGSASYCLTTRTGNCTDFHSLWTSLARASGIPTRIVYGSFFKAELDGRDEDQSYHCWPEFFAPGIGWVPHDVAVADIFAGGFETGPDNEKLVRLTTADGYAGPDPLKVDYYFGNIDERRVTWSRGRDLTLSPPQKGGPVNALAKAYVEVDGNVLPEKTGWVRKLTYRELKGR